MFEFMASSKMYSIIYLVAFISSKIVFDVDSCWLVWIQDFVFIRFYLLSLIFTSIQLSVVIDDFYVAYDFIIARFPQPTGIRESANVNACELSFTLTFNGHSVVKTMTYNRGYSKWFTPCGWIIWGNIQILFLNFCC